MHFPPSRTSIGMCLAVAAAAALPSAAAAHQSPAGCTSTSPNVQFGSTDSDANIGIIHRNGDVVQVLPRVGNSNSANPCDLEDVTLTVQFPTASGAATGPTSTVATGVDLPSGTPLTDFSQVTHTAGFDDGVFRGQVTLAYAGVHHTDPAHSDTPGPIGSAGRFLVISRPHATVTVTPTPASGDAPLGVTYTYSVHNDSPLNPMDIPTDMFPVEVADDRCSPVTFTGGNTDDDVAADARPRRDMDLHMQPHVPRRGVHEQRDAEREERPRRPPVADRHRSEHGQRQRSGHDPGQVAYRRLHPGRQRPDVHAHRHQQRQPAGHRAGERR